MRYNQSPGLPSLTTTTDNRAYRRARNKGMKKIQTSKENDREEDYEESPIPIIPVTDEERKSKSSGIFLLFFLLVIVVAVIFVMKQVFLHTQSISH